MELEPVKHPYRQPLIKISSERREGEGDVISLAVGTRANTPEQVRRSRDELLTRLHAQRHEILDQEAGRDLTDAERIDLADLELEIDRWEMHEERDNQEPRIRDIAALAERILGPR